MERVLGATLEGGVEHKLKSTDAAPDDRPRGYLRSDQSPPQEAARPRKAAISGVPPAARKASDPTGADHHVANPPHAPDGPCCPEGQEANPPPSGRALPEGTVYVLRRHQSEVLA